MNHPRRLDTVVAHLAASAAAILGVDARPAAAGPGQRAADGVVPGRHTHGRPCRGRRVPDRVQRPRHEPNARPSGCGWLAR